MHPDVKGNTEIKKRIDVSKEMLNKMKKKPKRILGA